MTRDDILQMAMQVWSAGSVYTGPSIDNLEKFATLVEQSAAKSEIAIADAYRCGREDGEFAERKVCAEKAGEFAQKWWSIHCANNRHMETTRKAHDDFCRLQATIRGRQDAQIAPRCD